MKKQMQKTTAAILALMMNIGLIVHAEEAWAKLDVVPNSINVTVDGIALTADNFLYQDTTYLPIRAVAEALGKDVSYDGATNTAIIADAENTPAAPSASAQSGNKGTGEWVKIDVSPNTINVMVNGTPLTADNFLYQDTTYLPIRAVAEALARDVAYDGATNTAIIGGTASPEPSATAQPADSPAPSADPTASASPEPSTEPLPDVNLEAQTEPLDASALRKVVYYTEWDWAPDYARFTGEMTIKPEEEEEKPSKFEPPVQPGHVKPKEPDKPSFPIGLTYYESRYMPAKIEKYIGLLQQLEFVHQPEYTKQVVFAKENHFIGLQKLENGNLRVTVGFLSCIDAELPGEIDANAKVSAVLLEEKSEKLVNGSIYQDDAGQKYVSIAQAALQITEWDISERLERFEWKLIRDQQAWQLVRTEHQNLQHRDGPFYATTTRKTDTIFWMGQAYRLGDEVNRYLMPIKEYEILFDFIQTFRK